MRNNKVYLKEKFICVHINKLSITFYNMGHFIMTAAEYEEIETISKFKEGIIS